MSKSECSIYWRHCILLQTFGRISSLSPSLTKWKKHYSLFTFWVGNLFRPWNSFVFHQDPCFICFYIETTKVLQILQGGTCLAASHPFPGYEPCLCLFPPSMDGISLSTSLHTFRRPIREVAGNKDGL